MTEIWLSFSREALWPATDEAAVMKLGCNQHSLAHSPAEGTDPLIPAVTGQAAGPGMNVGVV